MKYQVVRVLALLGVFAAGSPFARAAAQQSPDFLFRRPWVSLSFGVGYAAPRAGSDLFDFTREQLTVERSDFGAVALQSELALRPNERWDVAIDVGWSASRTRSEFRDWIGTDGLPIEQTTRFVRVPLTLGLQFHLRERGRSLGRFVWVPARWSAWVGAAGGAVWYQFEQEGEFVDYESRGIFRDYYLSEGWAPTAHVLAGAEWTLVPRVALTSEACYAWGSAGLSRTFEEFDDIDLAGFQATAGISLRF